MSPEVDIFTMVRDRGAKAAVGPPDELLGTHSDDFLHSFSTQTAPTVAKSMRDISIAAILNIYLISSPPRRLR
jgi:hypothetical protein